ncbi:MAG: DUF58 domain-containing protein [Alphaproteobacteria bacterium]
MAIRGISELRHDLARRFKHKLRERIRIRRGPVTLPFEFEYRHIFVLPTAFGFGFGVLLITMTLGGLNFNNNLTLMLVFLLAVIVQMTTALVYRNIVGLRIESIVSEAVFRGDHAEFKIYLRNAADRPRFAIQGGILRSADCIDLPPLSVKKITLTHPTTRRGWLEMPSFTLENRYPFGMFRAWVWFFPQQRCLVYPSPAKDAPPLPVSGIGRSGRSLKGDGEQIHGLRAYRTGDPLRRIAWRSSARHGELYTREMEQPHQESCQLRWGSLKGLDPESRLEILTRWVLQADHRNLRFSLELPSRVIPADRGPEHTRRALEALALFDS